MLACREKTAGASWYVTLLLGFYLILDQKWHKLRANIR
jgi:hypothetical protein